MERVRELKGRGLTRAQIASEVGLSTGSVSAALSSPAPAAGSSKGRGRSKVTAPPAPPAAPPEPGVPMTAEEQRAVLSDLLRDKARDARELRPSNPAEANTSARLATALAGALARITEPTPPRDPNEHPDMLEAARTGREKLRTYVEKIRLGK